MLTNIQYGILKRIYPRTLDSCCKSDHENKSKLATLGDEFLRKICGKIIIDFGCGEGTEAIEMTQKGAKRVIGIDIREDILQMARQKALTAGVQDTCLFASSTQERAEIIVSIDAFEHFAAPAAILRTMHELLQPGGEVLIRFGPTWYHPLGGHLFSVFPWAHLIFTEKALIRWRSTFKTDGATRFSEVEGGLNQMTISKFVKLVENSALELDTLELLPIGKLRPIHNRLTREFTTAIVRCRLIKRTAAQPVRE